MSQREEVAPLHQDSGLNEWVDVVSVLLELLSFQCPWDMLVEMSSRQVDLQV